MEKLSQGKTILSFLANNQEILTQYFEYKKSNEYKDSAAFKLMELMKNFNINNLLCYVANV